MEALFGSIRQASGCHYQQDALSVTSTLKKVLVTGIVASTTDSNCIVNSGSFAKAPVDTSIISSGSENINFSSSATGILNVLCQTQRNHCMPTSLHNISVALVAGYIVRVVGEKISCHFCF